jgi:geranylgeranyl pyrophosphate synthase
MESHEEVSSVLEAYSKALGIAYQIRDDLEDYTVGGAGAPADLEAMRPGVVLSAGWERAQGAAKEILTSRWKRESTHDADAVRQACTESGALDRCTDLLERYKEEAIRSLSELENASLKGLLRRVIGKIFNDTEIKGWCKEFEQANGVVS